MKEDKKKSQSRPAHKPRPQHLRRHARRLTALDKRLADFRGWMSGDPDLVSQLPEDTVGAREQKVARALSDIFDLCDKLKIDYKSLFSDEEAEVLSEREGSY